MSDNNMLVAAEAAARDAEECIVQLTPLQAEQVSNEVEAGDHQTFDDALAYIIERGLAEIHRQRQSAIKQQAKAKDAKAMLAARTLLANNPKLALDPAKLFELLGIPTPKL